MDNYEHTKLMIQNLQIQLEVKYDVQSKSMIQPCLIFDWKIPYGRKFSRDETFANFTSNDSFVKI